MDKTGSSDLLWDKKSLTLCLDLYYYYPYPAFWATLPQSTTTNLYTLRKDNDKTGLISLWLDVREKKAFELNEWTIKTIVI